MSIGNNNDLMKKLKSKLHRDLKPENLLLTENKEIILIDFGLSNQYREGQFLNTSCGSPCYAPPEMIVGKYYSGLAADIWSAGITLFAMVCGFLPFQVIAFIIIG